MSSVVGQYIEIKKRLTHLWRQYGSLNNIVLFTAVVIAASWAWGTVSTIQRNFDAQKNLDAKKRQLQLTELEVQALKYQQNYYKSDEYLDLSARKDLGLASPGEDVLILPLNSDRVVAEDAADSKTDDSTLVVNTATPSAPASNFDQWISFLTGQTASQVSSD